MPAGIRPPEAATVIVVLSPSMSNQMRCASASCRPPKPVPSIFSSRPATERSRSTGTGRSFADRCAANHFLDQITLFVDVNLRFVRRAEQVVVVAHYFLISPDQHEGEIISLVRIDLVELQYMLNVMQVDELVDHTVG